MIPERPVQSFNEKAALAELERLRESIQAARKARQRTSDEFEAFVKGFRTPPATPIAEHPIAPRRAPEAPQQAAAESISRPLQPADSLPPPVTVASTTDAFDARTVPPLATVPGRFRLNPRLLGTLAIIGVIAVGVLSVRRPREVPTPTPVNAVNDNAASTPNSAASTSPPAATALPPPQAPARNVVLELKIVRPVWMRVVVDGRTSVEGMVQGGEPLHFAGDNSIVVRVGNGGDVFVKTGDREESFGEAGQPLTRRFSKP